MKKLNTDSITNELERSSFFPTRSVQRREDPSPSKPTPQPLVTQPAKAVVNQPAPSPAPQVVTQRFTAPPMPVAPPTSRRYIRRTFDFYEDQIAYLTKASLEERLAGGEGSMNAMVREAIDTFIEKRRKK